MHDSGSKTLQRLLKGDTDESARRPTARSTSEALDLVLLFDTTGSMYTYLEKVRAKLAELASEVFSVIPNTRVGVVAFGDYSDAQSTYVVKVLELTSDFDQVQKFIFGVQPTGGGDQPEAIEEALYSANHLHWRIGARRAAVLVGDAPPHGVIDSRLDFQYGHFYLDEASSLGQKAVRLYTVQCGNDASAERSFQEMAKVTHGKYLHLEGIDDLVQLIAAISMKEVGLLSAYTDRLAELKQLTPSRQRLLAMLNDDA